MYAGGGFFLGTVKINSSACTHARSGVSDWCALLQHGLEPMRWKYDQVHRQGRLKTDEDRYYT